MTALTAAITAEPPLGSVAGAKPRRYLSLWEMLVWAYRDQLVAGPFGTDDQRRGPYVRLESSTDGVARMLRWAETEAWIDGGQHKGLNDRMHPDARAIAGAIGELDWAPARLIAEHAFRGEQPEPSMVQPTPFPTRVDGNDERWGRAVIDGMRINYRIASAGRVVDKVPRLDFRGRGRREIVGYDLIPVDVEYCPLSWWPSPEIVAQENAIYDAFAAGMVRLLEVVQGVEFRNHVVTGAGILPNVA